ncbi:beta-porphyranase A-like [Haliotis cracherodii]|uniref:beta-porphyranase A-like n=1 Tax=Haliotis cracherodii TaxID=6455 RepID=UPI0039E9299A
MLLLVLSTLLLWGETFSDTTVTIYNEWLAQGGRLHYEVQRWNKINGLTQLNLIPKIKSIGAAPGRWVNRDLRDDLFPNWPQNPSRHGYPDPAYLQDHALQARTFGWYVQQLNEYGNYIDNMVWNIEGQHWPSWIDKSHHQGKFPNNVDAASEFVSLMVQSAKDYTSGRLPYMFEALNEPDWVENIIDPQTNIDFHKAVADKLKSRFGMKVAGPSYTSMALRQGDENNFAYWKRTAKFLDMSLDHLDFFSFHSYNYLQMSGANHTFFGINEARLVATLDMIENYSHQKKGKNVQLVNTEFGLGLDNLVGVDREFENAMTDFETIYQPNGFMFTFLNLREFIDRVTIFLLSNEQYPGHTALRNSLFTQDGHPLEMTKFFLFWKNFVYDQRFLRVSSEYNGQERIVSPLALANPHTKEMVVLLHNYGSKFENVKLDFPNSWLNPSIGEETCILFENGKPTMNSDFKFDRSKLHGTVGLPGSSTCFYKFKTNYNFNGIHTDNEITYYGKDMLIPINNGHAQTTIHLPSSGYHTSYLRVGASRDKNANAKPRSVVFNGNTLSTSYMLFDASKIVGKTNWNVWVFMVPPSQMKTTNTVSMTYDGNGGHVTSVALVAGKLQ